MQQTLNTEEIHDRYNPAHRSECDNCYQSYEELQDKISYDLCEHGDDLGTEDEL